VCRAIAIEGHQDGRVYEAPRTAIRKALASRGALDPAYNA
jgi:hypothetical protein